MKVLGFADDFDIIGDSSENAMNTTRLLANETKIIGLQINNDKTEIMELLQNDEDPGDTEQLLSEKVEDLGSTQV